MSQGGGSAREFSPDANYLAVEIQRRHAPETWAAHIAAVDEDKREAVATYLRDIYRRIKTHRKDHENG